MANRSRAKWSPWSAKSSTFPAISSYGKHGTKHRDCGQKCVRNGMPVGLLTKDGKVYMLIDEEHDQRRDGLTNFRKAAVDG